MNRDLVIRQAISRWWVDRTSAGKWQEWSCRKLLKERLTGAQTGAFLAAMQVKGPSSGEIAEFARVMRVTCGTCLQGTFRDTP